VGHRLDREDPVPEVVHLVDDDVRPLEPLDRLVVRDPVYDVEVDGQLRARVDYMTRSLLLEVRRRVHHQRTLARDRAHGLVVAQIEAGWNYHRVGNPARRRVRADDPGVELLAVLELLRTLAADVVAEE